MRTLEIPRERWSSFVEIFNRTVGERPIRVEVIGRPLGDQEMAELLPFHGVEYDSKGSERGTFSVTVGSSRGELSHRVIGPTRIYLAQNDFGEIEWLAIVERGEAGDVETLIHFERVPELEAEYPHETRPA
jgi:hypothetical protein